MLGDPMKISQKFISVTISVCATVFILMMSASAQQTSTSDDTHDALAAASYCTSKGGVVETRQPYYGTNDPSPLRLAGQRQFCQFTNKNDGSRIHVLLSTLVATKPTLAALAYYAKIPLGTTGHGNPASYYCSQIGGTDLFGGISLAGGGWVKWGAIDESLEACIFPDMSSIDSWGLTYHSAGIIRGMGLGKVLKYHKPK
jgi:putative hemolysin